MTYTIIINHADTDMEFYADFASGLGLEQFKGEVQPDGELAHLFDHGWADDLPAAVNELEQLASNSNPGVAASAKVVLQAIGESGLTDGGLQLTNGVSEAGNNESLTEETSDDDATKTLQYLTDAWQDYP